MYKRQTRGDNVLDQLFYNFTDALVDSGVVEPIEGDADDGVPSDHGVVHAAFRMPRVPQYQVQQYEYYHNSLEEQLRFGDWIRGVDWSPVLSCTATSSKVERLHRILEEGMKHSFSLIKKKKKTSEPAWMSEKFRRLKAKRRRIYKKFG